MFGRILVPLDGSELAERALEPAFSIARMFASEVILLRVALLEEASLAATAAPLAFTELARSSHYFEVEAAEAYLSRLGEARAGQASAIHTQVVRGTPAQVIVEAAQQARIDLIVMSTHGRSGLGRLIYGSIAEAVLRGSQVPVLLIPNRHPKATNGA
jgi:nucleotide-binding universal stress UspA family protein